MKSRFLIEPNNRYYRRALLRERGFWSYNSKTSSADFLNVQFEEVSFVYKTKKFRFHCNRDWIDFLKIFGPFNHTLILGGNQTNLEEYLINNGIVRSVTSLDIIHNGPNQINQFADLNFVELQSETYDLIIAKSILHHLINLEHLLQEVNKSLKPGGKFLVFEYTGERKSQWSDTRIGLVNKELNLNDVISNYKFDRLKMNLYNEDPFEGIRSDEIPGILDALFSNSKIIEIKWGKLTWPINYHILHYCIEKGISLSEKNKKTITNRINEIEHKFQTKNELLSCNLFGLYSKSLKSVIIPVSKWDGDKIGLELKLHGPINVKIRSMKITYHEHTVIKLLVKAKKFIKNLWT